MALTSITKDFIVKSGLIVQGTNNPLTTATNNVGTLQVNGGGAFAKDIMVASTATIFGPTNLKNALNVTGNVTVGASKFTVDSSNGNIYTAGDVGIQGALNSTGSFSVNTVFTVDGISGDTYIDGNALVNGNAGVFGTFNSTGSFSVNTSKFTVDAANGNTHIEGNLDVTGTTYLSTLSISGGFIITDATYGSSAPAGALVLTSGGAYINKNLYIDDTVSAGVNTGALVLAQGGAYINQDLRIDGTEGGGANLGALYMPNGGAWFGSYTTINSTNNAGDSYPALSLAQGGLYVNKDIKSDSTTNAGAGTGALVVSSGGAYINKDVIIDGTTAGGVGQGALKVSAGGASIFGDVYVDSTSTAVDSAGGTAALRVAGGAWIGDNLIVKNANADTGTSLTNSLYLEGGAWINKTLHVVEDAVFDGNVWFNGPTTNVLSTNTVYTDNLINLHIPPDGVYGAWTGDDGKDIGFVFHYYNGADQNAGLVLANDTHYLEWYGSGATGTNTVSDGVYGTFKTGSIKLADTTAATNTGTGALTVEGGVGIAGDVYVGGTVYAAQVISSGGDVIATVTTATNLKLGGLGQIPIQNGDGSTTFIAAGTSEGQVLTWNTATSTATWQSASSTTVGNATTATNLAGGAQYDVPFQSATGQTTFDTGVFTYNDTTKTLTMNNIAVNGNSGNDATTQVAALNGESIELYSTDFAELNYDGTNFIWVNNDGAHMEAGGATFTVDTNGNAFLSGTGYLEAPYVRADNLTQNRVVLSDADHQLVDNANLTFDGTDLTIGGSGGNITMTGGNITGVNQISATELTANTITATNNLFLTDLSQNSVLFVGANGQVSEDNTNFTWSASGNQLNAANITGSVITATTTLYVTGTDASSTNTAAAGALQVTGGVGIAGGLYVDQNAYVNADLYVQGTLYVQGNSLDGVDTITGSTGTFIDLVSTGTIYANALQANTFSVNTFSAATIVSTATLDSNLNTYGYSIENVDASIKTNGGIKALGNVSVGKVLYVGMNDAGDVNGESPDGKTIDGVFITNSMQAGGSYTGITGTSAQTIDSWDKTTYTSAKYIVQVKDGSNIHVEELMVIHDGTDVFISEYGVVCNNGELGVFDGAISGGNVQITFTPTGATNMKIQVVRQSILTDLENYC